MDKYLVLPPPNTTARYILEHVSRHIWLSIPEFYELLWNKNPNAFKDLQCFKVQFSQLANRGFFEERVAPHERANLHQWRLSADAACIMIAPRLGRRIACPRPKERHLEAV